MLCPTDRVLMLRSETNKYKETVCRVQRGQQPKVNVFPRAHLSSPVRQLSWLATGRLKTC